MKKILKNTLIGIGAVASTLFVTTLIIITFNFIKDNAKTILIVTGITILLLSIVGIISLRKPIKRYLRRFT